MVLCPEVRQMWECFTMVNAVKPLGQTVINEKKTTSKYMLFDRYSLGIVQQ